MFFAVAISFPANEDAFINSSVGRQLNDVPSMGCNYSSNITITFDFTSIVNLYQEYDIDVSNYTEFSLYIWQSNSWVSVATEMEIDEAFKTVCVGLGNYKLLFSEITVDNEGIIDYSPIHISVTDYTGTYSVFSSPAENELFLNLYNFIAPFESNTSVWKYTSSSEHISEYIIPTTSVSSWEQTTSFPSQSLSKTSHHYFRTSFTISSLEDITNYFLRFQSSSALDLYVNGILVYKDPSDTRATGGVANPPFVNFVGVVNHLHEGSNTLLVHLRPLPSNVPSTVSHLFNLLARLQQTQVYESLRSGVVTTSPLLFNGDFTDEWSQTIEPSSSSSSSSSMGNVTVAWEYPSDWAITINALCVVDVVGYFNAIPESMVLFVQDNSASNGNPGGEAGNGEYIPLAACSHITINTENSQYDCCSLDVLTAHRKFQVMMTARPNTDTIMMSELILKTVPVETSTLSVSYPSAGLQTTVGQSTVCENIILSEPLELAYVTPISLSSSSSPVLPEGVTVNTFTGEVCLQADVDAELNDVLTLAVVTNGFSTNTTIALHRTFASCTHSEGNSVQTIPHNQIIEVRPCDEGYSGSVIRRCLQGNFTEELTENCVMLAPASLQYSPAPSYTAGSAIELTPSVSNLVTSFTVSPSLPASLTLHETTGVLSGTVNEAISTTYTITASNTAGSTAYSLSLVVVWNSCSVSEHYTSAEHGEEAIGDECPEGMEGETYRICTNGTLGEVQTDRCRAKSPTSLSYVNNEEFFVFDEIRLEPSMEGIVNEFTITPDLPSGVMLNATTGVIQGVFMTTVETKYTITARNKQGEVSTELLFVLKYRNCEGSEDGVVKEVGSYGSVKTLDCARWNGVGSRQYKCEVSVMKVEWVMVKNGCIAYSLIGVMVGVVVCLCVMVVVMLVMSAGKKGKAVKVEVMKDVYV